MNRNLSFRISADPLPQYFNSDDIDLDQFEAICRQTVNLDASPFADAVQQNIVIYSGDKLREAISDAATEAELKAELSRCLKDGPGIFVIQGAYPDTAVVDEMTAVFKKIIAKEKALIFLVNQGRGAVSVE